ncbi:YpmS family protein [Bacillus marasmi]|uniref:YpmS family protein n=1 Tax=Bacillus marasmi TaxID=1926279 RepID=UPI0011CAC72E|nr:YpmS family protein [Bacillus marasmi]
MKNIWKSLFLILLSLNILLVTILIIFLTSPAENKPLENTSPDINAVSFLIQGKKKDVNTVINQYLKEQNDGVIDYSIQLDDYVNLFGTFPFLNQNIDMKLVFEPKALENGDLILQERQISIGKLNLPSATVLRIVDSFYKFPEWVTIQPNEEQVYVDLQSLKLKSDVQIVANQFDLKQDQIIFTLLVPVKEQSK